MCLYAEIFEQADALPRLEAFASHFGADFYGISRNSGTLRLERVAWSVPDSYKFGEATVVPLRAGEIVQWRLARDGDEEKSHEEGSK